MARGTRGPVAPHQYRQYRRHQNPPLEAAQPPQPRRFSSPKRRCHPPEDQRELCPRCGLLLLLQYCLHKGKRTHGTPRSGEGQVEGYCNVHLVIAGRWCTLIELSALMIVVPLLKEIQGQKRIYLDWLMQVLSVIVMPPVNY